jgi:hydroxymethylpyrimidine pyrophosphatase-like HAD family hydrolase
MNDSLLIAVDFDGTIVEDRYPKIGKPMPFAIETLKMIVKDGHRILLWTYRHGEKLEEAVSFLKSNNVEIYAVNNSFPEEKYTTNMASRKINADLFIDDRNFGGFPGWGLIYQNIKGETNEFLKKPKNNLFNIFKKRV